MFCRKCGNEILRSSKYCDICGNPNPDYSQTEEAKLDVVEEESSTISTLALVFSLLFGMAPGLILAIVGLVKNKNPKNRRKCKWAIAIFIIWAVIGFIYGIYLGLKMAQV